MTNGSNTVEGAYALMKILKAIVAADRRRAESHPLDESNIALGLTEIDRSEAEARAKITQTFDALQFLLDHFSIFHMAACFERQALPIIANAIGEAKKAIKTNRDPRDPWPETLVRDLKEIQGLQQIEKTLNLADEERAIFSIVRNTRNNVGHGIPMDRTPAITAENAKDTLVGILVKMK